MYRAFVKLFLLIGCWAAATAFGQENIVLPPEDGRGLEIVRPDNPLSMVDLAAREFQQYFEKITGRRVTIVDAGNQAPDSFQIHIGWTPTARSFLPPEANLSSDGYYYHFGGNGLFIAGRDERVPVDLIFGGPIECHRSVDPVDGIAAAGQTGTLYGVYHFLEEFGGVRWYWPGPLGEVVPTQEQLVIPSLSREEAPDFATRQIYAFDYSIDRHAAVWYRRAGFGSPTDPMWVNHSSVYITRQDGVFEEHPEWFAMRNGERVEGSAFCWSQPGLPSLIDEWERLALEYFDRFPEAEMFPMAPMDGYVACGCPYCQAKVHGDGSISDLIWPPVNEVARRVREKHPDKYIGCFAYANYIQPPQTIDKLSSGTLVMFCTSTAYMWPGSTRQQSLLSLSDAWLDHEPGNFQMYDYLLLHGQGFTGYLGNNGLFVPFYMPNALQQRYSRLKGQAWGFLAQAENTPEIYPLSYWCHYGKDHLNFYLLGKMAWNPDVDIEALLDEHAQLFFEDASEPMREFYDTLANAWESNDITLQANDLHPFTWNQMYTPLVLDQLSALLAEAREKAPGGIVAQRLQLIADEFSIILDCAPSRWKGYPKKSILENGDFETTNTSGLKSWDTGNAVTTDATNAFSGERALMMESRVPGIVSDPIWLRANRAYFAAVWYRCEGTGNPESLENFPRLSILDAETGSEMGIDYARSYPANNAGWERMFVVFRGQDKAVRIRLLGAEEYRCFFDAATLQVLPLNWERSILGCPTYQGPFTFPDARVLEENWELYGQDWLPCEFQE